MEFFPKNAQVGSIGFATSASLAKTGSFIQNFAALSVTATIALNQTGSAGVNGTSAAGPAGPKGARGATGVTGPRGDSVYLISSSWHDASKVGASCSTPAPTNCWEVPLYAAYYLFGSYSCDFSTNAFNPTTYYTTTGASQAYVDANFGAGFDLYTNNTCTDTVASALSGFVTFPAVLGAHAGNGLNTVYTVQSNSTSSVGDVCGAGA